MRQKRKASNWQRVRKFFNDIHLWTGLISGLVVIVVCFSGTIYTYQKELTEWSASHLHWVDTAEGVRKPVAELLPTVLNDSEGSIRSVQIRADASRSVRVGFRKVGDQSRSGTTYFLNPYTGKLLGTSHDQEKTRTSKFMRDLFSLHRWLLFDRIDQPLIGELPNRNLGSYISGTATILFTLGVLTGIIIWFPQKLRTWRQGLKIKWAGGWKRLNHDLHNTLAFYSLIFLFLMGITGPQWSFPWYRTGLQKFLGTYKEAPAQTPNKVNNPTNENNSTLKDERRQPLSQENDFKLEPTTLDYEGLLATVHAALPYAGDVTIQFGENEHLTVRKNKTGFFAPAASDEVKLDGRTGEIQSVNRFRDKPLNERIAGSIKALHIGDVYGPFTKLLYFFSCLIATTLPITGTLIWLNKMKKKKRRLRK